jgi:UDP-glucose 4-epimerase
MSSSGAPPDHQSALPLTVAVTGPTGEIGLPFVRALERVPEVGRILAMARRPFDPRDLGWEKTEYRQGDILDRAAVDDLVAGSDVVVHLAFIVVQASAQSAEINIEGSRHVFESAVAAQVPRLVYTSSVAAYGYDGGTEGLLTEDMAARGSARHAYSRQKADVERVLHETVTGSPTGAYVFRPCVVAGPDARALIDQLPYHRVGQMLPDSLRHLPLGRIGIRPVLPDHGVPMQLVHHDDVAQALVAAVLGHGAPGVFNLAGEGVVRVRDIAEALGWYWFPVPRASAGVAARLLSFVPPLDVEAGWLEAVRAPMLMDTTRARRQLQWHPHYDARQTLAAMVNRERA